MYCRGGNKVVKYDAKNVGGFVISSSSEDVLVKNTGNVDIRIKNNSHQNLENASWQMLTPGNSIKLVTISNYPRIIIFLVDTMGIMFDNQGIDDLIFKPGTSQIVSDFSYSRYGNEPIQAILPH